MTEDRKPVDVLVLLDALIAQALRGDRDSGVGSIQRARAGIAELMALVEPRIAQSFEEASIAHDGGQHLIWCQQDVLNPCWMPGRSISTPLRHWGGGNACPDCQLRAALAVVRGRNMVDASNAAEARSAFEQWITEGGSQSRAAERNPSGDYRLMQTHAAWLAWQAAWSARDAAIAGAWSRSMSDLPDGTVA